ncbi:hypothetical protein LRP88_06538 [Fusarium phalaenopsidis]
MTRSGTVSSRDDYVFTISGTRYMAPRSRLATASLAYDVYHNCDDFRAKYHEAFGCAPYTTLLSKKQWSLLDTARNWLTRAGMPTSVETGKTIWK